MRLNELVSFDSKEVILERAGSMFTDVNNIYDMFFGPIIDGLKEGRIRSVDSFKKELKKFNEEITGSAMINRRLIVDRNMIELLREIPTGEFRFIFNDPRRDHTIASVRNSMVQLSLDHSKVMEFFTSGRMPRELSENYIKSRIARVLTKIYDDGQRMFEGVELSKKDDLVLSEAPLPDDWNHDIYNDRIPFKQRVEYAKERAQQLGSGSSRVVFEIPYKGRPTALKIAKNRKGMAQNEIEADILTDMYARMTELVVPIIDYDERNSMPTWIHTEKAPKIRSDSRFKALTGISTRELRDAIINFNSSGSVGDRYDDIEFVYNIIDLIQSFGLAGGDIVRLANWGEYRGRAVLVDVGATDDLIMRMY